VELRDSLIHYIKEYLAEDPDQIQGGAQPLITSGLLDSLSLVELQAFLDEEWGLRVPDEFMTVANFDTLDGMVAAINRHGEKGAADAG